MKILRAIDSACDAIRMLPAAVKFAVADWCRRGRIRRIIARVPAGMAAETGSKAFAFPIIVGSPRSGTTLLRLMLDAHPELAIPPETGFMVPALQLRGQGDSLRRAFFETVTTFPGGAPNWPDFCLSQAAFEKALKGINPFSISEGIRCFYRMYAQRFSKRRFGDKTPSYGLYLPAIEKALPEARFIHIIRDGRDVALSLRPLWFSPGWDMRILARAWFGDVSTIRRWGARSGRYCEVQYEELVLNARVVLQRICDFCDLEYHPAMEAYYHRAAERLGEHQGRRHSSGKWMVSREQRLAQQALTREPPAPSRIFAWKASMSGCEREIFERLAGPLLAELGYETLADRCR